MSCENNTNKVGQCAGAAGGISATQNKSSFINATFANRVLNLIDRDGVMAKVIRNPVGQLGTAPVKTGLMLANVGPLLVKATIDTVAGPFGKRPFGTGIEPDIARGELEHVIVPQTYEVNDREVKRPTPIPVYQDKTEPAVTCFQLEDGYWQKKPFKAGTLLTSTSLPFQHIFFRGELSNKEAVNIAAGVQKPHQIAGYMGSVSRTESLSPVWARAKRRMIEACFE